MMAFALTPKDLVLFIVIAILLLIIFIQRRDSTQLCKKMRRIRENHSIATMKAGNIFLDRRLLDEVNAMLDYVNWERRELYRREEEIRAMVTGISHDFRTPLTSISGYVQVMRENPDRLSREDKLRYLDIIEGRASSLAALANDFYTYCSLGSFDMQPQTESANPLNALRTVAAQYYLDLEKHFPEVRMDIPEMNIRAEIDRVFLERVFTNLVRNAISYGTEYFLIKARLDGNDVVISFSNGVPPQAKWNKENINRIFERKYSVNWTQGASSTGLGLYIARRLIEDMGGSMSAECRKEELSLICRLPLSSASSEKSRPA